MAMADLRELSLCYETYGRRGHPAIVLIRGLGTQLTEWPKALIDAFVREGLEVVVFDNRDAGLSSQMTDRVSEPPYQLADMAGDTVALLDYLHIERAHILGISLGGMIAQHVAMHYPQRTLSLISVMSSTSNPALPQPGPEIRARLIESADNAEALIALSAESRAVFGSPAYPETLGERLAQSKAAYVRSHHPDGVARQLRAAIADGSRVDRLLAIAVPTLVIHGADDPLVPVAAGVETAAVISGAQLQIVPGMGHNIPESLAPQIAALVLHFVGELPAGQP